MERKRSDWDEFKYTVILHNGEEKLYIGTHQEFCVSNEKFTIYNDNYISKKDEKNGEDDFIIAEFLITNIAGYKRSPSLIKKKGKNNSSTKK